MPEKNHSSPLLIITLISSNECSDCHDLFPELYFLHNIPFLQLDICDVNCEEIPDFAQGYIVPATYIGKSLWRYGKYSRGQLLERIGREIDTSLLQPYLTVD